MKLRINWAMKNWPFKFRVNCQCGAIYGTDTTKTKVSEDGKAFVTVPPCPDCNKTRNWGSIERMPDPVL